MTEIPVKDVFTVDQPKGAAGLSDPADQIWLWDTTAMNWKRYFYSSGRGSKVTGWCNEEDNTKITKLGFYEESEALTPEYYISGFSEVIWMMVDNL